MIEKTYRVSFSVDIALDGREDMELSDWVLANMKAYAWDALVGGQVKKLRYWNFDDGTEYFLANRDGVYTTTEVHLVPKD